MFLPAELGNLLGAQIDHPRTGSYDRRNIGRFGHLVKWFEKTAGQFESGFELVKGTLKCGRAAYRDPTRRVHTLCSQHQSEDKHRRECSDISCCGTPKPHRSHILPPFGKDTIRKKGKDFCMVSFKLCTTGLPTSYMRLFFLLLLTEVSS